MWGWPGSWPGPEEKPLHPKCSWFCKLENTRQLPGTFILRASTIPNRETLEISDAFPPPIPAG